MPSVGQSLRTIFEGLQANAPATVPAAAPWANQQQVAPAAAPRVALADPPAARYQVTGYPVTLTLYGILENPASYQDGALKVNLPAWVIEQILNGATSIEYSQPLPEEIITLPLQSTAAHFS